MKRIYAGSKVSGALSASPQTLFHSVPWHGTHQLVGVPLLIAAMCRDQGITRYLSGKARAWVRAADCGGGP